MKIGIIDADLVDNGTRHPNLALLKISAFYKKAGNDVTLLKEYNNIDDYDHVYISKVFSFTQTPSDLLSHNNVTIGGTGFFPDGGQNLPEEIEHHMPDYHLYDDFVKEQLEKGIERTHYSDYLDYSIGFTTRGCFRKCSFCVNKKYDHVFRHSTVSEFLDPTRSKIYLWDDNILAFPQWEEVFQELVDTGKPFQFRQGMDIRLMTSEKAEFISQVKYNGDFIFAFDHIEDSELIERKLHLWKKYCKRNTKLYVLTGYKSQDAQDIADTFERIRILMECGCNPYIMRYEDYKKSNFKSLYITIARWCNQPQFYKKMSFRQFCERNQYYKKRKDTLCSSMQAMYDFEIEYPNIAKKYFDLSYENLRQY